MKRYVNPEKYAVIKVSTPYPMLSKKYSSKDSCGNIAQDSYRVENVIATRKKVKHEQ